jgi:hypothetical protein
LLLRLIGGLNVFRICSVAVHARPLGVLRVAVRIRARIDLVELPLVVAFALGSLRGGLFQRGDGRVGCGVSGEACGWGLRRLGRHLRRRRRRVGVRHGD